MKVITFLKLYSVQSPHFITKEEFKPLWYDPCFYGYTLIKSFGRMLPIFYLFYEAYAPKTIYSNSIFMPR